jgi:hypothetical protein
MKIKIPAEAVQFIAAGEHVQFCGPVCACGCGCYYVMPVTATLGVLDPFLADPRELPDELLPLYTALQAERGVEVV